MCDECATKAGVEIFDAKQTAILSPQVSDALRRPAFEKSGCSRGVAVEGQVSLQAAWQKLDAALKSPVPLRSVQSTVGVSVLRGTALGDRGRAPPLRERCQGSGAWNQGVSAILWGRAEARAWAEGHGWKSTDYNALRRGLPIEGSSSGSEAGMCESVRRIPFEASTSDHF